MMLMTPHELCLDTKTTYSEPFVLRAQTKLNQDGASYLEGAQTSPHKLQIFGKLDFLRALNLSLRIYLWLWTLEW